MNEGRSRLDIEIKNAIYSPCASVCAVIHLTTKEICKESLSRVSLKCKCFSQAQTQCCFYCICIPLKHKCCGRGILNNFTVLKVTSSL